VTRLPKLHPKLTLIAVVAPGDAVNDSDYDSVAFCHSSQQVASLCVTSQCSNAELCSDAVV
jgi:hypothetical protein